MALQIVGHFFMPKFSQELRTKLIQYFEQTQGLVISDETADEFLDSLADLFLWPDIGEP